MKKTYISMVEAFSWVLYRDFSRFEQELPSRTKKQCGEWPITFPQQKACLKQALEALIAQGTAGEKTLTENEWHKITRCEEVGVGVFGLDYEPVLHFIQQSDESLHAMLDRISKEIEEDKKRELDIINAEHALEEALRNGSIRIWGNRNNNAAYEQIPNTALMDDRIEFCPYKNELFPNGIVTHVVKGGDTWRGLKIMSDEVLRLWPMEDRQTDTIASVDDLLSTVSNKINRKPTKDEVRDILREIYNDAPIGDKPNMSVAEGMCRKQISTKFAKPAGADSNTKRQIIRIVLEEDEFARQRNRAGKQTKS